MNSVQNQKSKETVKQEQIKYNPIKNLDVGSGAIKEWASSAVWSQRRVLYVVIGNTEKFLDN